MSIFKSHIAAMSAYKPPLEGRDPKDHLLLDFNERTIPVSEAIRKALEDFVNSGRLQMYPSYGNITERIADYCGVQADQVMITNGSDQGIDLIIRSACNAGDEIIIPGPSFAMYTQCAKVENLTIVEPHYTRDGGYPLAEVLAAITDKTRLIVVSNPNNPCGTLVSPQDILALAKAAPEAVILVDECYFEYSKTTVAEYVGSYPNLLITRTFSKTWGLPSIRLGYVISAAHNINTLLNVRGPYDINQFGVVAVEAALDDVASTEAYVDEVMEQAKPLLESYLKGQGISFWNSAANYLWVFPENPDAMNDKLIAADILVRPKADTEGRVGLRMTLGTLAQTQHLIDVLKA
jgi:histidinol-phosphate aminotransferase